MRWRRRSAVKRGGVVWHRGVALLAAAVAAVSACSEPRHQVVEMSGFEYRPATLTVAVGDTVEFINHDMVPHTASARDGAWDSGQIAAGATWRFVARESGDVSYLCTLHPAMMGALVVR